MTQITFSDFKTIAYCVLKDYNKFVFTPQCLLQKVFTNKRFGENEFSSKPELLPKFKALVNEIKHSSSEIDALYLENDIKLAANLVDEFDNKYDLERLSDLMGSSVDVLNRIFDCNVSNELQLFIVDSFPYPYDNITIWDFFCSDAEDFNKYGIDIGIYVHKERQFPYYLEILLIHEVVHFFIDKIRKNKFIKQHWIEEGIADWLSYIVHYQIFKDIEIIKHVKTINRIYSDIFPQSALAEYQNYHVTLQHIFNAGGNKAIKNLLQKYILKPDSPYWKELFFDINIANFKLLKDFTQAHKHQNELDFILSSCGLQTNIINVSSAEYHILLSLFKGIDPFDNHFSESTFKNLNNALTQLKQCGYVLQNKENLQTTTTIMEMMESKLIKINLY